MRTEFDRAYDREKIKAKVLSGILSGVCFTSFWLGNFEERALTVLVFVILLVVLSVYFSHEAVAWRAYMKTDGTKL